MKKKLVICTLIGLVLSPISNATDYRFPREPGITKDGYPLPLTGEPITKTPIIGNKPELAKKYAKHYVPGTETLGDNEMRITACGSWSTAPQRIAQGASCILVELGNGDSFIFDVGGGTVGNLFALGVHPANLDKLFISHFHLDHIGGIFPLFDAMGWARNTPLQIWGSSGYRPDLGVTAFAKNVMAAAKWHIEHKQNILAKGGMLIQAHEIDINKFSPKNPRQIAYDKDGVKIYAFPVIHALAGSMGYRLEWKDRVFVYTADSQPSTFEAEQGKNADVFIHEVFPSSQEFGHYNHLPTKAAEGVTEEHTTPAELGRVYSLAKPRLGVGFHFPLEDNLIDSLFQRWSTTYNEPVLLIQDLTTINVTSDYIISRQTKADLLGWPAPPPQLPEGTDMSRGELSKAQRPAWLTRTRLKKKP